MMMMPHSKSKQRQKSLWNFLGDRVRSLCALNKIQIYKKIHLMPPFSCKKISLGKKYITKFKESLTIRV
jgi:hypothetical protein